MARFILLMLVLISGCNPSYVSPTGVRWYHPNRVATDADNQFWLQYVNRNYGAHGDNLAVECRITHWWTGAAVPQDAINRAWFGYAFPYADDLIRVESIAKDGTVIDVYFLFLSTQGNTSVAFAKILNNNEVPQPFR